MARYIDAEKIVFWIRHVSKDGLEDDVRKIAFSDEIARMPTADVAPRAEVFEEVDKFRTDLMNKFIDLCRGNDYNKLTLLKIGDVVDEMYDRRIAELNKCMKGGE